MKFTEQITQLWNNEELDNDAKLVTLLDMTKNYVPKARVDEYARRVSTLENEKEQLSTEFDDFKKSKMTDDEKVKAEREAFESSKKTIAREKSSLAVEKLLLKNGIEIKDDDTELKDTLETIVSEDYDKSIKLANSFISLINKTKDNTAKQTVTDLLNGTPKPITSTPDAGTTSNYDAYKTKYDEAVKSNDMPSQVAYMRLMQEELSKTKQL